MAVIGSAATVLGLSETLSRNFSSLSQQYLEIKHYHTFLSLPEIDEKEKSIDIIKPHIVFDNVHFTYPKANKPVLKGVSFEISPRQRVAIVGENGAGKSTIIKLLCKLYKPDSGKITINGINLDDIPFSQLKRIYSVVFQHYSSYSLTLRENIAFGDIDKLKDDKAILDAVNKGLATEVLNKMPKGIDTNLGKLEDDGVDLSGGQWQRVAIARACVSDSAFVILDEPTSALDPVVETEILKQFIEIARDKTAVIISHRVGLCKFADKIIVMKDGQICEIGTHDSLINKNGEYKRLYTSQEQWYR